MKSKIAKMSAPILAAISSTAGLTPVSAVDSVCDTSASDEIKAAAGCPGYGTGDDLPNVIVNILDAIIGIAGLISVIWIIIGGVSYMTSSGDPSKTKKARDTVLYACIGLIVCVLAFVIVNFVILEVLKKA